MIQSIALAAGGSPDGTPAGIAETVANLFHRIDALAKPDELVANLQQVHIALAGVFIACGLVCMLQGFKLYKGVVIGVAFIVGLSMGYQLGAKVQEEFIVAVCLGVLLAVVAWPLMKYAVAVVCGLLGASVGANAWAGAAYLLTQSGFNVPDDPRIGALVGLMLLGLLSFILFELSVVLFTSFSGSVLVVLGIIAMLLQVESWRSAIHDSLVDKPIVLPLLVMVPAVIGLVVQQQRGGCKAKKPGADKAAKPPAAVPAKA